MDNNEFERTITVLPAYDCHDGCEFGSERCSPDSGGYHGISDAQIAFCLKGKRGAVSFTAPSLRMGLAGSTTIRQFGGMNSSSITPTVSTSARRVTPMGAHWRPRMPTTPW
jgi:hypothetical protein